MESDMKLKVKEYYADRAQQPGSGCGCGPSCCGGGLYDISMLAGVPGEAVSLSLGCGNPFVMAELKEGDVVLDLGSGGGLDVLIAAGKVGDKGKVYGLDMTDEMLAAAEKNRQEAGAENVEFLKGCLEDIPLPDKSVDVIISNCVLNLSEDKEQALLQAYRVLKKGGRFSVSDVIALKEIPPELRRDARAWASCLSGAITVEEYTALMERAGFSGIVVEQGQVFDHSSMLNKEGKGGELVPGEACFANASIRGYK